MDSSSSSSNNYDTRNTLSHTAIPEKKCFVKVVAIGDSGVGKTSLI